MDFDMSKYIDTVPGTSSYKPTTTTSSDDIVEKKKRGRKKKEDSNTAVEVINMTPQTSMSYIQQNIPYQVMYSETDAQLDSLTSDLEGLAVSTMMDMNTVRASKTYKNKYSTLTNMTENAISIANARLAVIKEKNSMRKNVADLELKRQQQLKTQADMKDDNTRIADLYGALVSTPINQNGLFGPKIEDLTISGGTMLPSYSIGGSDADQANWEANLSPAESRMVYEAKGLIETVVVFDEATGNRYFEVIDKTTGQPVANVEKPDDSFIYDLDIRLKDGYAKDANRKTTYPLRVVNSGM